MKQGFEIAAYVLYGVSAVLWIVSAAKRLTKVGKGQDELDKVHLLSRDLQRAAWWSAGAASCMALGLIAQTLAIYLAG